MCLGNRASDTTRWINQQLFTLWQLSVDCVKSHECDRRIKYAQAGFAQSTCLAQICVGRHGDLSFFCEFEAPEIEFICNHDVLVKFQVKGGDIKIKPRGVS